MKWITKPISRCCEYGDNPQCGQPTSYAYKVMGGGWMALCDFHAGKHMVYAEPIRTLLAKGEKFAESARTET